MGEGGGQVLRTALSLSSMLSLPVRIENIRAGRPKPGLKPSHLTAVRALSAISSAEVYGDSIGSPSLFFSPGSVRGGVFSFDTGTAGSITLIMQALLPVMVFSGGHFRVSISGGTDVAWSPPIDHTRNVLLPILASAGAVIETEVERRGYYPRGGGKVRTEVGLSSFHGLSLSGSQRSGAVKGHLHISGLPSHVALRLMASADSHFSRAGISPEWEVEADEHLCAELECSSVSPKTRSPGVSATVWSAGTAFSIGASSIGRRGVSAETVGKKVSIPFIKDMEAGASVDVHTADQLLIYIALSRLLREVPSSFSVRELSSHALTTMQLIEEMTGVAFARQRKGNLWQVSV